MKKKRILAKVIGGKQNTLILIPEKKKFGRGIDIFDFLGSELIDLQ